MSDFILTKTSKTKNRRRGRKRRWIKRFGIGFAVLLILLVGLGFVFRAPLGEKLRTTLDGVLAEQGVYVDYGIDDFSVLRGLMLMDVLIYETAERNEPLLSLSNVEIGYDLVSLLKSRAESQIILRTEDSTVSLFEGGEAREITGIDSRLTLGQTALGIHSFQAEFRDISADLTGSIEFAPVETVEKASGEAKPERVEGTSSIDLRPVIAILDQLPDTPDGEIFIKGRIDSTREGLTWEATITGDTVNYSQLQLKSVSIQVASLDPTTIQFPQAAFEFQERAFSARGRYEMTEQRLTLDSLSSGIDVKALLTAIEPEMGAKMPALPAYQLNAKGAITFLALGQSQLDGTIAVTEATTVPVGEKVVPVQSADVAFAIADGRLDVNPLDAMIGAGEAPLKIQAEATMALPMGEGAEITSMALKSVMVNQTDRQLSLNGTLDLADGALQIDALDSSLDPFAVMNALELSDGPAPVTFADGPTIKASGRVPFAAPLGGGLSGRVGVEGDISVPLGEGEPPLVFSNLSSAFSLEEGTVVLPDLTTQSMGGEIRYNGRITPAESVRFDGALVVDQVQLQQIMRLAGQSEERTGNVVLTFTGHGSTSLESMSGNGALKITDAEFVSVPIYSGLRPLLTAINLGVWKGDQSGAELTASYQLAGGTLESEDILLVGAFYEIGSMLNLDFANRTVAATGAVSTTGATKVLTGLVGKLLEVEAEGEFGAIRWKLKNAPGIGDLDSLTGKSADWITDTLLDAGVAKAAVRLPGNLLKQIGSSAGDGAAVQTLLETPTDAVEQVGGAIGKLLPFGKKKDPENPKP